VIIAILLAAASLWASPPPPPKTPPGAELRIPEKAGPRLVTLPTRDKK
jgi:hypothetical protein